MAFPVDKKKKDGVEIFDDSMHMVLLGGLLFGVFQVLNARKSKNNTDEVEEPKEVPYVPPSATYDDKVRALQTALKVGVDGQAGKETNGTLENLFSTPPKSVPFETSFKQGYPNLKARGKGVVSPDNVDFYINAIRTKTYPSNLYTTNQSVKKDADAIKNAYAKGGLLKTRNVLTAKGVIKDNARNLWVTTGKTYSYKANVTFISPEIASRSYVTISDVTTNGNLIVRVVTLTSTYFLLVSPSSVIVS